jgi:hypothetical protein
VVRQAKSFRLVSGNLQEAVQVVSEITGSFASSRARAGGRP